MPRDCWSNKRPRARSPRHLNRFRCWRTIAQRPWHRVLKAGSIEFNGGVIDCTIRNVSDTGAAIEVASPVGVPDSFWLVVSGDHTRRHCRVAWRTDKRIGVAFD